MQSSLDQSTGGSPVAVPSDPGMPWLHRQTTLSRAQAKAQGILVPRREKSRLRFTCSPSVLSGRPFRSRGGLESDRRAKSEVALVKFRECGEHVERRKADAGTNLTNLFYSKCSDGRNAADELTVFIRHHLTTPIIANLGMPQGVAVTLWADVVLRDGSWAWAEPVCIPAHEACKTCSRSALNFA